MANTSPFRIFRKYQKALLVGAGVILMFVFVIGDSLVAYLSGSRASGGGDTSRDARAVAVRWDGGSLTNQEVNNLVMRRRIINSFIQNVEFAGRESAMRAGVDPRPLRVQPILGADRPQDGVEGDVVRMKLFADAAREAGMQVSDEAIVAYLDELGRGNVTREDMRAMLNQLPGGAQVPINFVIDALRDEMLARNFVAGYAYALETVTPEQRYKDWLDVNDRVVVEAAPIPVETHMVDVPEPTDAELAKFFDEHKDREPQPDFIGDTEYPSPTPGFRIPRKIDVQFVQADYDPYLEKVETEITEEEIAKYYTDNRDSFIRADMDLIDAPTEDAKTEGAETPATGENLAEGTEQTPPATDATGSTDANTGTTGGATSNADPTQDSEIETPAGDVQPRAPGETQPPAEPAGDAAAPDDGDQSSRRLEGRRDGVFHLAAFLQPSEGSSTPATETSEASDASAEPASTGTETPTTTNGQPGAAGESETTRAATDAATPATPESSAAPAAGATEPAGTAPQAEVEPKEYQSLDEVRDEIRRLLASRKVNEQLTTLMNELQTQVNGEFNRYFSAQLEAQAKNEAAPAPPAALVDWSGLAQKHGLKYDKTGPISWLELRKTPVGQSGDVETHNELYRILFASDDLDMFEPMSTEDINANRYLVSKISDTPGRVPALAEVRADVVRAWKKQKAAELAKKDAEKLAQKAQDEKSPLTDFFADQKPVEIVRTDPFSRFTGGEVGVVGGQFQQKPFRLSEPDGIVAAGPEFMDAVFKLKVGEVGAALNHDQSIAYVVRVAEHQLPPDELRTAYLSEANNWPGANIMTRSHAQTAARLLVTDLLASKGLTWERPPDQLESDDEEADE